MFSVEYCTQHPQLPHSKENNTARMIHGPSMLGKCSVGHQPFGPQVNTVLDTFWTTFTPLSRPLSDAYYTIFGPVLGKSADHFKSRFKSILNQIYTNLFIYSWFT
jgi:hypothetical protein